MQEREIAERVSKENALAEKTRQEQMQVEQQALIEKERMVRLAQERKEQETRVMEAHKEKAILVAEEEKNQAVEIAKIERETKTAEQLKQKLAMLEETAKQEALKVKAEEQAITMRALEIANREKEAEIIEAEKRAKVNLTAANVEADREAYKLTTVAQAQRDSAELELEAAMKKAKAILEIGNANTSNTAAQLAAENTIGKNAILMQSLNQVIPLLPEIIQKLMLPAEKIDSIKFLNINGMQGVGGNGGNALQVSDGGMGIPSTTGGIIQTMFNVSMLMPVMKEVIKTLRSDSDLGEFLQVVERIPGGEMLLNYIEKSKGELQEN
jgi:uncharacterized membrane protein YqiK